MLVLWWDEREARRCRGFCEAYNHSPVLMLVQPLDGNKSAITYFLHTLFAHTFCTLFLHTLFAHSFCTLFLHTLFAHSFCTLFLHSFCTLFLHTLFALFLHTLFAHSFCTLFLHSLFAHPFCTLFLHTLMINVLPTASGHAYRQCTGAFKLKLS